MLRLCFYGVHFHFLAQSVAVYAKDAACMDLVAACTTKNLRQQRLFNFSKDKAVEIFWVHSTDLIEEFRDLVLNDCFQREAV